MRIFSKAGLVDYLFQERILRKIESVLLLHQEWFKRVVIGPGMKYF